MLPNIPCLENIWHTSHQNQLIAIISLGSDIVIRSQAVISLTFYWLLSSLHTVSGNTLAVAIHSMSGLAHVSFSSNRLALVALSMAHCCAWDLSGSNGTLDSSLAICIRKPLYHIHILDVHLHLKLLVLKSLVLAWSFAFFRETGLQLVF